MKVVILVFVGLCFFSDLLTARPKAFVIGASSGIGRAVAKKLAEKYDLAIAARRVELLESLRNEILSDNKNVAQVFIKQMDVTKVQELEQNIAELIVEMGGLDVAVISVTAFSQEVPPDRDTLNVDLVGFYNAASFIIEFFKQQKHGHLVGMSSMDALRGNALCPVYSGAKAFISTYLEGVRNYCIQNNIPVSVTDILPGWVNKENVDFNQVPGTYWVIDAEEAAEDIFWAIEKKKKRAFVPKRWQFIAWLWGILPDCVYNASWWPWR